MDIENELATGLPDGVLDFVSDGFVQAWNKGEYESSFGHIDRGDRMEVLRRCFHLIPGEQKYVVFDSVFTDSEYDYIIPMKMETEIRFLRPAGVEEELRRRADADGCLTIYLGVNDWTMEVEKTMPWTLSKERAEWFARRSDLEKKARVNTARVHIDDVITWTDSRNEDAVLIRYENLKGISTEVLPALKERKAKLRIKNRTARKIES